MHQLSKLELHYNEFLDKGRSMALCALKGHKEQGCAHDNSFIKVPSGNNQVSGFALIIDVGGTHVKAAVVDLSMIDNVSAWRFLFDKQNEEFLVQEKSTIPIEGFVTALAAECCTALNQEIIRLINSVAVVWSNAVVSKPISDGTLRGVTGVFSGLSADTYRKNEWYVDGLRDGYDLGALFITELNKIGFKAQRFILANDTIFTLSSLKDSCAGIVISSGANCTHVGTREEEKDIIFNTEFGSLYVLPDEWLEEGDLQFIEQRQSSLALEDLMSGKWLPELFLSHYSLIAEKEARLLRENNFDMRELAKIATVNLHTYSSETIAVAQELIRRAGIAAAGLVYFSIANQLEHRKEIKAVAVDSAMARYLPGFWETLNSMFSKHVSQGESIQAILVHPITINAQSISVPMQGAARILSIDAD